MGGIDSSGSTTFYTIDVDSSSNMVVGGESSDSGVLNSMGDYPNPILMLIEANGVYRWHKTFDSFYDKVAVAKFRPDGERIFVVLQKANLRYAFAVLFASDG